MSVFLIGSFYRSRWSTATLREAHQALQPTPFESAPERAPDVVECQIGPERVPDRDYRSFDEFVDELDRVDEGAVFYEYDPGTLQVTYRAGPAIGDMPMPVGFSGLTDRWFDPQQHGADAVEEHVTDLVEGFRRVATVVDPDLAVLLLFNDHGRAEAVPESHLPPDHGLEGLPFLLVLSEPWIEHCCGRDRILDAPVHETVPLDTGSILVRARARPALHGCNYEQGFAYLFGE